MEIKTAFFALIIVGVLITAVGVIVGDWANEYDSGLTSDLEEYNQLAGVTTEARTQQQGVSPDNPTQDTDFEGSIFRGAYGILSTLYSPFRVVFGEGGMIDSVTDRFGLPNYVRQGLVAMIIIAFTMTIVAVIFRLNRTSA